MQQKRSLKNTAAILSIWINVLLRY